LPFFPEDVPLSVVAITILISMIWDLSTGSPLRQLNDYGCGTRSVSITGDGRIVGAACADAKLHFWNTITGAKLASI